MVVSAVPPMTSDTRVASNIRPSSASKRKLRRARPDIVCQRSEREIEGKSYALTARRRRQVQRTGAYRKIASRRDDIEMIGGKCCALVGLNDCHRGMLGEKIDHHACMRWVEMLDENIGDAGMRRED